MIFKLKDVYVQQKELNDSVADLVAHLEFDSSLDHAPDFEIYVNKEPIKPNQTKIKANRNAEMHFQIKNPKHWWPHNLGEPNLYKIEIVAKQKGKILDSLELKKGVRTIELVAEKDSIGQSFYFKVNGKPVYAKGANYIPQHSLQSQVKSKNYNQLIDEVVDANMNMLRVWGGGIYELDEFYALCDEKGVLVWQDFMFACAMYPGDEDFLNNVRVEAEQQVKRLRNYASVALWCGNNENSEGWHRWGWQANRSKAEKAEIWNNYLKLFDSILPMTVAKYSDTDYSESSPKYGRGNPKYEFEGDAHDWWIWHDAYPFEHLNQHVPRFMSEFGSQSLRSADAIRYILQNDSISMDSEQFKNHQKHHRGFELIQEYMARDFPVPNNLEDYAYMSQVLQAHGIGLGIKAHRRAKPYNMGTLYWQLNDCWPAVSWSSIDFLGKRKALHFKLKQLYANTLITTTIHNNQLQTYLVNDAFAAQKSELTIRVQDFEGNTLLENSLDVKIAGNSSELVHELPLNYLPKIKNNLYIRLNFMDQEEVVHLVKPKELQLKKDTIDSQITAIQNGFAIKLWSATYHKYVLLETTSEGRFSDNFVELFPDEEKLIYFASKDEKLNKLSITSLSNFVMD